MSRLVECRQCGIFRDDHKHVVTNMPLTKMMIGQSYCRSCLEGIGRQWQEAAFEVVGTRAEVRDTKRGDTLSTLPSRQDAIVAMARYACWDPARKLHAVKVTTRRRKKA